MGLFDRFKKKDTGRFVPEDEYRRNLASQKTMTPKTMDQLRQLGVGPERRLKVELFLYSNTLAKAEALAQALRAMNYEVDAMPSEKGVEFLTTGWTTPISMTDSEMLEWTERMCEIGYQHDCEFDGWGTTPDQQAPIPSLIMATKKNALEWTLAPAPESKDHVRHPFSSF